MTADRWEKVKQLFAEALEVPEDQRAELLHRVCGSDDELTREVYRLQDTSAEVHVPTLFNPSGPHNLRMMRRAEGPSGQARRASVES